MTLGALKNMVPMSQIFFGTDFPFGASAQQHKLLVESGVFQRLRTPGDRLRKRRPSFTALQSLTHAECDARLENELQR